jgi:hypothetical protein
MEELDFPLKFNVFADKYNIRVKDLSDTLNMMTAPRIYREHQKLPVLLIASKNDKNRIAFLKKTINPDEDTLVIYKNQYRCFNMDKEWEDAKIEIEKLIINQKYPVK